jgi:hypothetical protein
MINTAFANAKELEVSAVIIRADGTREDLGTIQYWHKSVLKRIFWRIKKWLPF